MNWFSRHGHWLLTIFVAFVFIQSLFFKFTGSPETVYIFQTKLDPWAASLGFPGVFAPGGLFSAKVVGSAELIASVLLLAGAALSSRRAVQVLGAAMGLAVTLETYTAGFGNTKTTDFDTTLRLVPFY